jgi:hypothetical protein
VAYENVLSVSSDNESADRTFKKVNLLFKTTTFKVTAILSHTQFSFSVESASDLLECWIYIELCKSDGSPVHSSFLLIYLNPFYRLYYINPFFCGE